MSMKGNVYEKINYFENWSKQNCLKKKKNVSEKLSHYLIVILTFLLACAYVVVPAYLMEAVYLPFLVILRLNVA